MTERFILVIFLSIIIHTSYRDNREKPVFQVALGENGH